MTQDETLHATRLLAEHLTQRFFNAPVPDSVRLSSFTLTLAAVAKLGDYHESAGGLRLADGVMVKGPEEMIDLIAERAKKMLTQLRVLETANLAPSNETLQ